MDQFIGYYFMKIKYLYWWLFTLVVFITNICFALTLEEVNLVKHALKKVIPNFDMSSASIELIQPNLFKILSKAEVFYISKDGKYFFYGDLIDLTEKNTRNWNITDNTKRAVRKTELNKLSKKDMLIFKPKHLAYGSRNSLGAVTVFADVSCPHSKRLHKEIEAAVSKGLEVRYLFFPRAGVGSDSYKKAVSIWCAKNRNKEFAMANNDIEITEKTCKNNPVEDQFNFGIKIGINATPTIVLENGSIIPGFITADHLLNIVKETNAHLSS